MNVPISVGIVHRLQAILRAAFVSVVRLDARTVLVLALREAAPHQLEPIRFNRVFGNWRVSGQQQVKVRWDRRALLAVTRPLARHGAHVHFEIPFQRVEELLELMDGCLVPGIPRGGCCNEPLPRDGTEPLRNCVHGPPVSGLDSLVPVGRTMRLAWCDA